MAIWIAIGFTWFQLQKLCDTVGLICRSVLIAMLLLLFLLLPLLLLPRGGHRLLMIARCVLVAVAFATAAVVLSELGGTGLVGAVEALNGLNSLGGGERAQCSDVQLNDEKNEQREGWRESTLQSWQKRESRPRW